MSHDMSGSFGELLGNEVECSSALPQLATLPESIGVTSNRRPLCNDRAEVKPEPE